MHENSIFHSLFIIISLILEYVREFETQQTMLSKGIDSTARKKALLKVQKVLIIMQDIGDEKLQIMQTIQDLIEKKARQLDIDYKNLSMIYFFNLTYFSYENILLIIIYIFFNLQNPN